MFAGGIESDENLFGAQDLAAVAEFEKSGGETQQGFTAGVEVFRGEGAGLGRRVAFQEVVGHHERERDGELEPPVLQAADGGDLVGAVRMDRRCGEREGEQQDEPSENRRREKNETVHGRGGEPGAGASTLFHGAGRAGRLQGKGTVRSKEGKGGRAGVGRVPVKSAGWR